MSHGYAPQHWDVRCMRKCGAVVPPEPNLHAGILSVLAEMAEHLATLRRYRLK